jgi:hypothetical protein
VFKYSGVSCEALSTAVAGDNLMIFIGPNLLVADAVKNKLVSEILDKIPLLSDADQKNVEKFVAKATKPPEVSVKNDEVKIKTPIGTAKVRSPW